MYTQSVLTSIQFFVVACNLWSLLKMASNGKEILEVSPTQKQYPINLRIVLACQVILIVVLELPMCF